MTPGIPWLKPLAAAPNMDMWSSGASLSLFRLFYFFSFLFRVCSPDEQATKVVSSNSSWCWNSIRSSSIWERTVVGQSNNLGLLSFRRSQEEENRRRGEEEKGTLPKRKEKERKKERKTERVAHRSFIRPSIRPSVVSVTHSVVDCDGSCPFTDCIAFRSRGFCLSLSFEFAFLYFHFHILHVLSHAQKQQWPIVPFNPPPVYKDVGQITTHLRFLPRPRWKKISHYIITKRWNDNKRNKKAAGEKLSQEGGRHQMPSGRMWRALCNGQVRAKRSLGLEWWSGGQRHGMRPAHMIVRSRWEKGKKNGKCINYMLDSSSCSG